MHKLLIRHSFSCQVPARRAVERRGRGRLLGEGDLAASGRVAAALDAWIVFENESGFSMTPPTARTWGRRGHTPIRVRASSEATRSATGLSRYFAENSAEKSRLHRVPGVRLADTAGQCGLAAVITTNAR